MKHSTIFLAFITFRNSGKWAASKLGVSKQTISAWLRGKQTNARLDAEMPKLAAELLATRGKCITDAQDADGPSARSRVNRIRAASKKRTK